jgi:hypothetical protein
MESHPGRAETQIIYFFAILCTTIFILMKMTVRALKLKLQEAINRPNKLDQMYKREPIQDPRDEMAWDDPGEWNVVTQDDEPGEEESEGQVMPDYYSSAKGTKISKKRAYQELKDHGLEQNWGDFIEELGVHPAYDAQKVLDWLGY